MKKNINTNAWRLFSTTIVILTMGFAVSFGFHLLPSHRGLMQRGFFITIMLWILVTATISILVKLEPTKAS